MLLKCLVVVLSVVVATGKIISLISEKRFKNNIEKFTQFGERLNQVRLDLD